MLIQYSQETKSIYDQFWNAFWATFHLIFAFLFWRFHQLWLQSVDNKTKKEECQKALQN
jgi:hypothetical protein